MTVAEKEAMTLYARVLALAAALALSAAHAEAQDKTLELRLSHFLPPTHPVHKALEDWGRSIEKASNGTIEYKIYPA
jgi:TRAP-type C4-dicarboxylate transport system substrate-binding protein